MKRHLRLWFVLLISLVLPVNGMAAFELGSEPCQMGGSMSAMAAPADHLAHADSPAMNAADDSGHTHDDDGAPCPSGQQCKSGSMLLLDMARPMPASAPLKMAVYFPDAIPTPVDDNHWRPPRV
ncbi:hypothetical protein [Stutzerimonas stutzeri]|jgi:hypothetical protein|uniref:DUF2946 domain-containing protein n=1 Tax=Stutzerimonas stutzeri TaxID=316 RepID=A0A0D9AN76_STUST|nr:hypothetical protein [Stutzerimonas stutzeri]KJH82448.1 hypothetical protein UF78_10005 [Stutzerimonas stutzeri]